MALNEKDAVLLWIADGPIAPDSFSSLRKWADDVMDEAKRVLNEDKDGIQATTEEKGL